MRFRRGCQVAEELGETCVDATQSSGPPLLVPEFGRLKNLMPTRLPKIRSRRRCLECATSPAGHRRVRRRTSLAGAPRRMRGWQR